MAWLCHSVINDWLWLICLHIYWMSRAEMLMALVYHSHSVPHGEVRTTSLLDKSERLNFSFFPPRKLCRNTKQAKARALRTIEGRLPNVNRLRRNDGTHTHTLHGVEKFQGKLRWIQAFEKLCDSGWLPVTRCRFWPIFMHGCETGSSASRAQFPWRAVAGQRRDSTGECLRTTCIKSSALQLPRLRPPLLRQAT